jgi:ABC-type transport system involved in multi-copper enzyme maturation permease subunit
MAATPTDQSTLLPTEHQERHRIFRNPIIRKEIRTRMRSLRTFFVVTVFLGVVSASAALILTLLVYSTSQPGTLEILRRSGTFVFYTIFLIELFLISFIAPALTSGAISAEREHQTFDLLRTTLLSTTQIILGKLGASMAFLLLLLLSTLPLYALAFTFGGISIGQISVAWLIIVWTAVLYAALGLFFSPIIRRTLLATVVSYIVVGIVTIGIPVFLLSSISIFFPLLGLDFNTPSLAIQVILLTLGWVLVFVNPLSAAVATEIANINDQTLWLLNLPLSNGGTYTVLSPWIPFSIFCAIVITLLILLSIRITARPEK